MSENPESNPLSRSSLDEEATAANGDSSRAASPSIVRDGLPHVKVRGLAGLSVVDIVNTDTLFEEGAIRELSTQLHGLVDAGCTRFFLNFGGIRYLSSDVLAALAGLHRRVGREQGRLGLFGLDPVLRDMMHICHLERVFDIYTDEGEALSHGQPGGDQP